MSVSVRCRVDGRQRGQPCSVLRALFLSPQCSPLPSPALLLQPSTFKLLQITQVLGKFQKMERMESFRDERNWISKGKISFIKSFFLKAFLFVVRFLV